MAHLELGTVWHDCVLVRTSEGELSSFKVLKPEGATQSMTEQLEKYKKENPRYGEDDGTIWYDLRHNFCFGSAQYKRWPGTSSLPSKDHSFFCNRDQFIDFGRDFIKRGLRESETFLKAPIVEDKEFFIGYPKFLEKFKDKSVMIVGGGPSANSVNWDNIDTDYLWSINKFYLNEKVASKGVDLATVASHIDILNDNLLKKYIENNDTIISFELERGNLTGEYNKYQELSKFSMMYPDQTTFFHTRYKSQPGVGMRFICYAILLGCKDIYFVGVDGFTKQGPLHSFEEDKENPNWYNKFGNDFQIRQYVIFWDYLMRLKERYDYNIYNLGEDNEANISGEISKLVSPLPEIIKEKLND